MKTAREAALEAICRVHETRSYANLILSRLLAESDLSKRDRALVTELVYGTLRNEGTLDWILSRFYPQKPSKIPEKALDILRLGCYQILYLDKIPNHAVCNEAVELAKKYFHPAMGGFVNAILRRIIREKERLPWPDYQDDPIGYISFKHSHPRWIVEMWVEDFGLEETALLCQANNVRPRMVIRVNTFKISPSNLARRFESEGLKISPSWLPEALIVEDMGNVTELTEFKEGLFLLQDESSILVGHIVDPKPGEVILDTCAAPGGKTTHLAQLMGNEGRIIAVDIHQSRLRLVKDNCSRLGIKNVQIIQGDSTRLGEVVEKPVDKVLVDAPCSGLGVLARRPDARWRKTPQQIDELSILQSRLLDSASKFVKRKGVLVYSVCTISKKESEQVMKGFLKKHPEFSLEDISSFLPPPLRAEMPLKFIQLLPHRHGTDGLFVCRFKKEG
ncbi:MAG: 16S rRNA (cytosine(967)-C(5))-methyltransferase RsmB [Actinomycetota bacterium]